MHKLHTFALFLSVINFVSSNQQDNGNVDRKDRLLLTDPDFAGTRLTNIEKTIQDLTQSVSQLKGELAQEKQESAQEKQTVLQLQNELIQEKHTRAQEKAELEKVLQSFQGFTAGQIYQYQSKYIGGPANTLCLPNNPELSNKTAPGGSFIYGTEFQSGNFFRKGADNEDVPCAFCRSINTTTSVMIPGRKSCYSGWKIEYHSFLASNTLWHKPSSYICVDSDPEYLPGGARNDDHNLLYATGAQCGSLPCPPYSNNMAVFCVVCSK